MWCVDSKKYGREDFATEEEAIERFNELSKLGIEVYIRKKELDDLMDDLAVIAQKAGISVEGLSYDYYPNCEYDFSAKKRAELHLHTKLSDDISVIGVEEIFEKAEEYGLSAVAFTNLNNVQDFPKIANCAKKSTLKVIYGAEVFYKSQYNACIYKLTLLVKNQNGVKELYRVISSLRNDGECDLIDLDILKQNRKNLLVGTSGYEGELFDKIANCETDENIIKLASFYDYFELLPAKNEKAKEINQKIAELGNELGVLVIASSNAHYLEREDAVCRDILRVSRVMENDDDESLYLRKTSKMLEEYSYLGEETVNNVVFKNPKIVADLIEDVKPIKEGRYIVKLENAYEELERLCCEGASKIYGAFVNEFVYERLNTELRFIKEYSFESEYLLTHKLVKFLKDKGHIVGARGMEGSSLVVFLLGITDINPLPKHSFCSACGYFVSGDLEFNGNTCPVCGEPLKTEGYNIPYEIFMGPNGDKVPDFDLNLSTKAQQMAVEYLQQLLGADKVARAGIVSTIHERYAEVAVMEYEQEVGTVFPYDDRQKIVEKLIDSKSYNGVHPGGVMIIPQGMEIEDFTPIRKGDGRLAVTHLDFHALHDAILKQDILSLKTIGFLELLCEKTGVSLNEIDLNDPEIYSFFYLGDTTGLGDYEYEIVRKMLIKTNARSFNDLIKISGFAHGTDVWIGNGENLIKKGVPLSKIPTVRDDIMNDLINIGVERQEAHSFCDAVRKGLIARGRLSEEKLKRFKEITKPLGDWYFDYCAKVRYMFPKAHAVSYVMNALRCAWFKKYYPESFREAYIECLFEDEG